MRLLLALFLLSFSGCCSLASTFTTLSGGHAPRPYEGMQTWWEIITHYDSGAVVGVFLIPDVPFTFVMDTLLLPLTLITTFAFRITGS